MRGTDLARRRGATRVVLECSGLRRACRGRASLPTVPVPCPIAHPPAPRCGTSPLAPPYAARGPERPPWRGEVSRRLEHRRRGVAQLVPAAALAAAFWPCASASRREVVDVQRAGSPPLGRSWRRCPRLAAVRLLEHRLQHGASLHPEALRQPPSREKRLIRRRPFWCEYCNQTVERSCEARRVREKKPWQQQ